MNQNMAKAAETLAELRAEVAKLRARIGAHEEAQRLISVGLDAATRPMPPRLRVITCSGRRRTARRGKLALVGGAA